MAVADKIEKWKPYIRPLEIIMVSLFGFLLIVSFYAHKSNFKMSAKELHGQVLNKQYVIDKEQVMKMSNYQLIDIRKHEDYVIDHTEGSLNVPLPALLNEEHQNLFKSDNAKIIMGHAPLKAHEAWMLLTQLGVENLYVLQIE
ncbi:MAG: rhodanese-like domain-containing protein [Cyclobacteriaceae bacterium]